MRILSSNPNVDNSDLVNYPNGRIKNDDGSGNGTAVNERVYGDLHQNIAKLMRLYGIIPNGFPDSEGNDFQIIEALRSLASKNDFILALTNSSGILSVPIKLNSMLVGEQVVCKSSVAFSTQTQITGSDSTTFTVAVLGDFKTSEYVRLIKTSGGVTLVRLADNISLDDMAINLSFLKKASQAQENAGAIDTVATTPLVNLVAFIRRVNGLDSANYLATAIVNGLYPKEHFSVVVGLLALKNRGWFSGLNVGGGVIGSSLSVSGDITLATITFASSNYSVIRCTMTNTMTNTNYEVQTSLESQADFDVDTTSNQIVFKPISTTQFDIGIRETGDFSQSYKIHCRVTQLT